MPEKILLKKPIVIRISEGDESKVADVGEALRWLEEYDGDRRFTPCPKRFARSIGDADSQEGACRDARV